RTHSPHDLAFIPGNPGGMHHFAFWLDDWSEIGRAADVIVRGGSTIDAGPTRHGITRGHTIYFFDPSGNRNEVFTGGYWADPRMEPITWTADKLWTGTCTAASSVHHTRAQLGTSAWLLYTWWPYTHGRCHAVRRSTVGRDPPLSK